jgi:hypothetical protein
MRPAKYRDEGSHKDFTLGLMPFAKVKLERKCPIPLPHTWNKHLKSSINAYPKAVARRLEELRRLILETARETPGVGSVEERLRWGQPSFLTSQTGSGSTIRIDGFKNDPEKFAIFFHCQSGLVDQFRELYPHQFRFVGKRAIEFGVREKLPEHALKHCIALALTHHLRKKTSRRRTAR